MLQWLTQIKYYQNSNIGLKITPDFYNSNSTKKKCDFKNEKKVLRWLTQIGFIIKFLSGFLKVYLLLSTLAQLQCCEKCASVVNSYWLQMHLLKCVLKLYLIYITLAQLQWSVFLKCKIKVASFVFKFNDREVVINSASMPPSVPLTASATQPDNLCHPNLTISTPDSLATKLYVPFICLHPTPSKLSNEFPQHWRSHDWDLHVLDINASVI